VESVDFDEDAQAIVVSVRPVARARNREGFKNSIGVVTRRFTSRFRTD
jgi:hypothetical protein